MIAKASRKLIEQAGVSPVAPARAFDAPSQARGEKTLQAKPCPLNAAGSVPVTDHLQGISAAL